MADLQLERKPDDRLYVLEGVGTLRLEGFALPRATAETDGQRLQFARRRGWRQPIEATDASGASVGQFSPRGLRRGGTLRWSGRELTLRPAGQRREQRYALADGDHELAVFDGREPVAITADHPRSIEPGLLLFATFVAHTLAQDAEAAASTGWPGGG